VQNEGFNLITITSTAFDSYYILRDGIVIAHVTGTTYSDYCCNGSIVYTIRGIMLDDSFADLKLSATYNCAKNALIDPKTHEIIYLNERLDAKPTLSRSRAIDASGTAYLGKTKRSYNIGTLSTRSWSITCDTELELGKDYFFRNYAGQSAFVICTEDSAKYQPIIQVHEYQYSLLETDYSEAIDYEVES
jgi:hypothetical protein